MFQNNAPKIPEDVIRQGRKLYGSQFDGIITAYQALAPFLGDDSGKALEALLKPVDSEGIGKLASKACVKFHRSQKQLNYEEFEQALAKRLSGKASWLRQQEGNPERNPEMFRLSLEGLELLMLEALEDCAVISIVHDGVSGHSGVHPSLGNYGRKVFTGQPDLGTRHGYDSHSRPPV